MARAGLSDEEIEALYAHGQGMLEFARRVEAAVLAKIDSATTLIYDGCVWTKKKTEANNG